MRFIRRLAATVIAIASFQLAFTQSFPVRVNTYLTAPHSLKLSDYSSSVADRIVFNLFADVSRPELQVKFKLTIEGQDIVLTTTPTYNPPPVTLRGGISERLTGLDLSDYFNTANLTFQGITRQQFERTGMLPEGLYRFQLEVLEYNRGVRISNVGSAHAWLILNDPPVINLPRQNEKLKARSPQNVVLQWTPRHTGSPNSAGFQTEYEVTMVELWPANRNPNDAILTSPPIFQTTTGNTTLIYGPEETPLEPGRHYAFRIRAKSIDGVEELDLFKNNGYSEVFTFIYGDACDLPTGVDAKALSSARFMVHWDGLFNHTSYKVRYREAGKANANWYESNTVLTETEIVSLKPNTKYEYQVAGVCGPFDGPYSTLATITTPEVPPTAYSCGLPVEAIPIDPSNLVASLKPGDIIEAGDFSVTLTRVSGSSGTFSGEGTIEVPYLKNAKVNAKFTNIVVNAQLRMVNGYMNVTGAALDIVPDAVTAKLAELNETLDELDAVLNSAEDILDDVDAVLNVTQQVLNEVMEYLPNDIVQEITAARTDISVAKDKVRAATSDEAKAEAKAEVKAGKDRLKSAATAALEYYADAIQKFVNIVITSLRELSQEYLGKKDQNESALNASGEDLNNFVNNSNGVGAGGNVELLHLYDNSYTLTEAEVEAKRNADPDFRSYYDKTLDYVIKLRDYKVTQVLIALATDIVNKNEVDDFAGLLKQEGVDILKDIATQLKERKEEREIIDRTKGQIVASLTNVMDVIISK